MIEKIVEDTAVELLRIAATELPVEYVEEMDRLMRETEGSVGKSQMANILENVKIAREGSKPMCQDTGVVAFMAKVGDGFPLRSKLKDVLVEATKRATKEVPLRPNAVDMFKGNTGNNVGLNGHVPVIYIDMVPGDSLELVAMPKGGGSSNVAAHRMLKPGLGLKGVKQFVVEAVAQAGSLGCPPYFVGVGIGGGEDACMKLAKNALLRLFKVRSPDSKVAEIEEELLVKLNELGIGVMGLGEGPSVLDVHVEMAARHPASLPVGVVISCWALRHAKATISAAGKVEIDKSA
ncbi:MAG TPA: fumarate hydratase [Candidatus Krumholzibacteriaceae bacterium]|nr:fumarate hydratase [Candidatus Krumholzibacteriaceae bacterium]